MSRSGAHGPSDPRQLPSLVQPRAAAASSRGYLRSCTAIRTWGGGGFALPSRAWRRRHMLYRLLADADEARTLG
eukprot:scaffold1012_cov418-Prasinococcus_capsulatus_cf.AAC.14